MLLQAAGELDIDLEDSCLIGDTVTDIQAAQAVGVKPYLVLTGLGKRQYLESLHQESNGFRLSLNLWKAVDDILRAEPLQ
jgi:histidinol phosphatase-like enzyme